MNTTPFAFRDFVRVKDAVREALFDQPQPFVLLTGETGSGKTAVLRELRNELDRARHRFMYFSQARKLGAAGLVKVIGEMLRVPTSMCHAVSFERILRALADEPHTWLVMLDEAQELPEDTFIEARALAESALDGPLPIQFMLVGLPKLRLALQAQPALWRRIAVREELNGLCFDELPGFINHHFPQLGQQLGEQALQALFERANGLPGMLLPMTRAVLTRAPAKDGQIELFDVDNALERWELP